jgi:hypothetical protein
MAAPFFRINGDRKVAIQRITHEVRADAAAMTPHPRDGETPCHPPATGDHYEKTAYWT